jgi:hypothetical protein
MITTAAIALLACSAAARAAVIQFDGTMSSYTTVVGVTDPYAIGLPETYSIVLNTSSNSLLNGTLTFTGGSGKQLSVSGGTITVGSTTDLTGISVATTGGAIGGSVSLSFNTVIPNTTQAGLDTLIGKSGSSSLFGFPFTNGTQGFYTGNATAVAVPEPAALGTLGFGLVLLRRRGR